MDRPAGRRAMRPRDSIISLMAYLMAGFPDISEQVLL